MTSPADRSQPAKERPATQAPPTAVPPVERAAPPVERAAPPVRPHRVTGTRISGAWMASVLFALVLLLLLIFIMQNGQRFEISFLWFHGSPPVGVALLLAAVLGILLVVIPGTARIVQLRMVARRLRQKETPPPRVPADGVPRNPSTKS